MQLCHRETSVYRAEIGIPSNLVIVQYSLPQVDIDSQLAVLIPCEDSNERSHMNMSKVIALTFVFLICGVSSTTGQQTQTATLKSDAPATAENHKTVGFRLVNWQTKHLHDAKAAQELAESLKKVGCEVQQAAHNGHIDVRFRCPSWKMITVENKDYAVQWNNWLKNAGMETVVEDPAESIAKDTVQYRLTDWKRMHLHDPAKVSEVTNMLKMVGCETETADHNGHVDIRFRCPEWKTIALHNHAASHHWQEWLNKNGFETKHSH